MSHDARRSRPWSAPVVHRCGKPAGQDVFEGVAEGDFDDEPLVEPLFEDPDEPDDSDEPDDPDEEPESEVEDPDDDSDAAFSEEPLADALAAASVLAAERLSLR
jgi:hypothetical protein